VHDGAFFRLPLGERIEALLAEAAVIDQEDLVSRLPRKNVSSFTSSRPSSTRTLSP